MASERAARREALLKASAAADAAEEAQEKCKLEKALSAAKEAGVTQDEGRAWMDAAKQGDVAAMAAMVERNGRVLEYKGQGTSYSLMGHTALHWCAAKGHILAAKFLLDRGLDANATNNGGTHALFSAAAHGRADLARFLLVYGRCDAKLQDEFGNTAREEAAARKNDAVVSEIDLYSRVMEVIAAGASAVPVKVAMAMLQLGGVPQCEWHGVERSELNKCADGFAQAKHEAAMADYRTLSDGGARTSTSGGSKRSAAPPAKHKESPTAAKATPPAPAPTANVAPPESSGASSKNQKKKEKKKEKKAASKAAASREEENDEAPAGREPGPPYLELYNALELEPSCTPEQIRKSYRTLSLKWHPDKNGGDPAAMERFQSISTANDVLSDPRRRRLYDRTGEREDISVEDFKATFKEMMAELFGDMSINDVMATLSPSDLKRMPPFPFPAFMFPAGTFPKGMKFSDGVDTMGSPWEDLFPPEALATIQLDPSRSYGRPKRGGRASARGGGGRGRGGRGRPGQDDDDDDDDDDMLPTGMSEEAMLRMFSEMLDADHAASGGKKSKKGKRGGRGGTPEVTPEMLKKMMATMMKMEMSGGLEDEDDFEDDDDSDASDEPPPRAKPSFSNKSRASAPPPSAPPPSSHQPYETVPTAAAVDEAAPTQTNGNGDEEGESLVEQCRKKGNEAFAQGNYTKAEHQYSMALRFDKSNHILLSNRSASRCAQKKYELALEDADACIRLSKEKWPKAFARKGAALVGLGQAGEALKWYQKGLNIDANDTACQNGIAEANRAIAEAQRRYDEMWGNGGSGGGRASAPRSRSTPAAAEASPASSSSVAAPAVQSAADSAAMLRARKSAAAEGGHPRDVVKRWLDAAKEGDLDGLRSDVARYGPSIVNVAGTGIGHRALHWTCARGHVACSRYLLSVGADPNLTNSADRTALHAAASNGEATSCVLMLLEGLCDPTAVDEDGMDPLTLAKNAGHAATAAAIERSIEPAAVARAAASAEVVPGDNARAAAPSPAVPVEDAMDSAALTEEEEAEYGMAGEDSSQPTAQRSDVRKGLGNVAFGQGEYGVAARHYTNALALWADAPAAEVKASEGRRARAVLYANRSACRLRRSQSDLALEDALAAQAADKGYSKAHVRLAQAHLALGHRTDAIKACEQGLLVDTSNAGLHDLLAELRGGA